MTGIFRSMAALFLLFGLASLAVCQDESGRSLQIPLPEGSDIDDAAWRRIQAGFGDEKQGFLRLLIELQANEIDYSVDSLNDIQRKRKAVSQALGTSQSQIVQAMGDPELEIDYLRVSWETVPRLTGRVLTVGTNGDARTLSSALPRLQSGDEVRLAPGKHNFEVPPSWTPPSDIALVGAGRNVTTLASSGRMPNKTIERWRFSDLTIDCGGRARVVESPLPAGALHLVRCKFTRFRVHRGVFSGGRMLLAEDCSFDGSDENFGARVFGSPGGWQAIYMRGCEFINTREISSFPLGPFVLDACTMRNGRFPAMPIRGSRVLLRDCENWPATQTGQKFEVETDDLECVLLALGEREDALEPRIMRIVEGLRLSRNPYCWLGLLRSPDPEIRRRAAERVDQLFGVRVKATNAKPKVEQPEDVAPDDVARAIRDLDDDRFAVREGAKQTLLEVGPPAVDALREILDQGTLEQRQSAKFILAKIEQPPTREPVPRAWDLEYGRLARWYETERQRLVWSKDMGRYVRAPE